MEQGPWNTFLVTTMNPPSSTLCRTHRRSASGQLVERFFVGSFFFTTGKLCKPAPGTTHAIVPLGNLDLFAELFALVENNNWKNDWD
jgi:hypothetical protein